MDISDQEFNNLVLAVTEKVLLRMPEVIGNLMMNHAETQKLSKKFYSDYPEFKDNQLAVKSVLEQVEQENSGMTYDKVLAKAAPMIKERLGQVKGLDFEKVKSINELNLSMDNANGVL